MKIEVEKRLRDALSACNKLADLSSGRDYEWYRANEIYRLACERLLEIVGEALKAALDLDHDLLHAIPEIRSAIGLRNRVIHEYDAVDDLILWTTIEFNIPELTTRLNILLGGTSVNG